MKIVIAGAGAIGGYLGARLTRAGADVLLFARGPHLRAMQERRMSHAQLMAEAKEAFAKMLADAQLARKGGRPRTNPVAPAAASVAAVTKPAK